MFIIFFETHQKDAELRNNPFQYRVYELSKNLKVDKSRGQVHNDDNQVFFNISIFMYSIN